MKKLFFAFALTAGVGAQGRAPFTLDQLLSYPFPDNLVASPIGSTIAWVFNERGTQSHPI